MSDQKKWDDPVDEKDMRRPLRKPETSLFRALWPTKPVRLGEALIKAAQMEEKEGGPAAAARAGLRALKAGAEVDFPTLDTEERALHLAAKSNKEELCRILIKAGADLEAGDFNQSTPLQLAVEDGKKEAARILLEAGANPNAAAGAMRKSPLHLAARREDWAMAELLLEFGAQQTRDVWDNYPLHYVEGMRLGRLLVEIGGADPEATGEDGMSALDRARKSATSTTAQQTHQALMLEALARREAQAIESATRAPETAAAKRPRARV